jgi:hypothetical protein
MSMLSKIAVAASIADFAVKKFFFDLLKIDTVAAAGSLISDATPLKYGRNVVTAANGTKAVRLPKAEVDASVVIINTVANQTLIVFPELATDQINAITAGDAFSLVGGARGEFLCDTNGHWYVAAANLTGTSTSATTLQLDQAAIPSAGVETVAATNVIAATESGMTYFLSHATEFASTLPAPAAGLKFTFIVADAPETASYTIVTNAAAQVIFGHQVSVAGDAGDVEATGGATTITFVDGQAVVGDRAYLISDGTNWYAEVVTAVAAGATITG